MAEPTHAERMKKVGGVQKGAAKTPEWQFGTAAKDPTYDATSVPAGAPLPTNQPPRTTKRSFSQEDL